MRRREKQEGTLRYFLLFVLPSKIRKKEKNYLFTISYLTELSSKQTICYDFEKQNMYLIIHVILFTLEKRKNDLPNLKIEIQTAKPLFVL